PRRRGNRPSHHRAVRAGADLPGRAGDRAAADQMDGDPRNRPRGDQGRHPQPSRGDPPPGDDPMTRPSAMFVPAIALSLAACTGNNAAPLQGYVEGTYVYVAAEAAGRLTERPAVAGGTIAAGALLAKLDDSDQVEAVAGAAARLAQAKAQL